ncbi:MAG: sigma-54-dependent transcriptional regulator [Rectinemataceae bacterium]
MSRILIIDDEPRILSTLSTFLEIKGHQVAVAATRDEAMKEIGDIRPAIVLLDLFLGRSSGLAVLGEILKVDPQCEVVMISGHGDITQAVKAIQAGARDFLEKPIDTDRLELLLANLLRERDLRDEVDALLDQWREANFFVGGSREMRSAEEMIRRSASSLLTFLVTGPNGCGKEVLARYIHLSGDRAGKSFVTVNCAAIPRELFESELFGHAKGAFTGALADREGYFARADGGVLFLDEIADIPLDLQPKLLRAIENGEIHQVGAARERKVSVRIIAATNRELREMVRDGRFREDLYYRICQVPIEIPSLDRRREDIPDLIDFILRQQRERSEDLLTLDSRNYLGSRSYPGNIRELKNLLLRILVLCPERPVGISEILAIDAHSRNPSAPFLIAGTTPDAAGPTPDSRDDPFGVPMNLVEARRSLERRYLETQLRLHAFSVKRTSASLGLLPNNLSRRLASLGIHLPTAPD